MAKKQTKHVEQQPEEEEEQQLVKSPLSSVAKSTKNKKRSKKRNLEISLKNSPMAKKPTKTVEQPLREEEPQVSMEEEEGEKEELVKPPSSSPAGKQDADSVAAKSKKEAQYLSSAAVVSPKKRAMEEGSTRDVDAKLVKTEEKKTNFKRLWSKADEIVLLQAIIDFDMDPFKDKIRFQESVEKSWISIEFTNDQLMSKLRNLQRKFKSKENKEVLTFSNPHDRTCFEMSQKIWGSKVEEEEDRNNGENDWFDKSFLVGKVASFGMREEDVKETWKLVRIERKREIEEKWRLLEKERIKFLLRQIVLVNDTASAFAEATS